MCVFRISIAKLKQNDALYILLIACVGLIQSAPAIFYGIFDAYDLIPYHLKWSKHFAIQFWNGDLYPRWIQAMNAGLGSPTFFFYPPVPYYFTSLLHPFFTFDSQGWYQLSVAAGLALMASGFTAYIWLKTLTTRKVAALGSIIYICLPYHTGFDLYWRFAYAEYWSFVWMPLIMYFSQKIIRGHKSNLIGFAVSLALLSMTHLPTFLIFFPIPLSYIIVMVNGNIQRRVLLKLVVGIVIAVGLSAIYWFPAMTTQEYISMDQIQAGYYFYGNNFLFANHQGEEWRYLELLTSIAAGLVLCVRIAIHNRATVVEQREANYWFVIAIISLLMTIPISKPIWDAVTVIQRLQYPWRFHTIVTLAITAILTLAISQLQQSEFLTKKNYIVSWIIFLISGLLLAFAQVLPLIQYRFGIDNYFPTWLILSVIAIIVFTFIYLNSKIQIQLNKTSAVAIVLTISLLLSNSIIVVTRLNKERDISIWSYSLPESLLSRDANEYRTKWASEKTFESKFLEEISKKSGTVTVAKGEGNAIAQTWKPRQITLQVNAKTDILLTINQFYYPNWIARTDQFSQPLAVQPSQEEGLLQLRVPPGQHSLQVTLDAGVEERIGQSTSAGFGVLTLFLLFWWRKSPNKVAVE